MVPLQPQQAGCGRRLGPNEEINFNAGDHCVSVSMSCQDYLKAEPPELGEFGQQQ